MSDYVPTPRDPTLPAPPGNGALVYAMPSAPMRTAPPLGPFHAEQDDPFDLSHLFKVIRTRMWLVVAVTVLTFTGAALYTFQLTPVYESVAQILIEPQKPNIVNATDIYGGENFGHATSYYNTQLALLRSERIARLTLARLGIQRMPGQPLAASKDALISLINKGTAVTLGKESRLFNVSFNSSDAEFAARVANAVVESYIDDTRERTHGVSDVGLKQLREKAADMQPRVEAAHEKYQEYLATHRMTSTIGSETALTSQLDQHRSRLGSVQVERQAKEALAALLAGREDAVLVNPGMRLDPMLEQLRIQLLQSESNMERLRATYNEEHPEVQKAKPQLQFLRKKFAEELKLQADRTSLELKYLVAQEAELTKQVTDLETQITEINNKRVKLTMLQQEASTLRDAYDGVCKRIEQIDLARATGREDENIFIIERARAARLPIWPNIPMNLLLGLAAGVFIGAVLAFLLDVLDNTVKSKEEIEKLLGLPVIGFVPRIAKITRIAIGKQVMKVPAEQVALYDANSAVAESFRTIRTGLNFSLPPDHNRTILITSATPGDGKSLVASNIAISLAQRGDRVLLVDADMRRPRQASIMGLEDDEGLSTLLAANGSATGLGSVCVSPVANLDVLASGPSPHNPAELLGSESMRAFVERATASYDWVVFDAPPMNAVADPAILMSHLPHVLFVVRSFHTQREQAVLAAEMIRNTSARSVGVILNTVDVPTAYSSHPYYGVNHLYYHRYQTRSKKRALPDAIPEGRARLAVAASPAAVIESQNVQSAAALDRQWIALSQAALLLGTSDADVAQVADREDWPVRSGRGPQGVTEPHYPIERVRGHLTRGA